MESWGRHRSFRTYAEKFDQRVVERFGVHLTSRAVQSVTAVVHNMYGSLFVAGPANFPRFDPCNNESVIQMPTKDETAEALSPLRKSCRLSIVLLIPRCATLIAEVSNGVWVWLVGGARHLDFLETSKNRVEALHAKSQRKKQSERRPALFSCPCCHTSFGQRSNLLCYGSKGVRVVRHEHWFLPNFT